MQFMKEIRKKEKLETILTYNKVLSYKKIL